MKLRNKKTGEIVEATDFNIMSEYTSLAELNEEWEDYEEPKEFWYIDFDGDILSCDEPFDDETEAKRKAIGNYFETKEEAELAVEKLKAWKRLKDKGFRFTNWEFRDVLNGDLVIEAKLNFDNTSSIQRDLEVCFRR